MSAVKAGCRGACVALFAVLPEPILSTNIPSQARAGDEPITPIPAAAVQNVKRLELGERLFSDRRLSRGNSRSCMACHDLKTNGASASARDVTADGRELPFNTPHRFQRKPELSPELGGQIPLAGSIGGRRPHQQRDHGVKS
jgi:cytochrome c peroxidase